MRFEGELPEFCSSDFENLPADPGAAVCSELDGSDGGDGDTAGKTHSYVRKPGSLTTC